MTWAQLISLMLKSKTAKVAAGVGGGTSLLTLILGLHSDIKKDIEQQMILEAARRKEYVKLILQPVNTEIKNLNKETSETKEMVRDIHNYLLNEKHK